MPCPAGFSFICWLSVEKFPTDDALVVFGVRGSGRWLVKLAVRPDGKFELATTASPSRGGEPGTGTVFAKAPALQRARWTHVALVQYPAHRSNAPTIRLFLDGTLVDAFNWSYPKLDSTTTYIIGDEAGTAGPSNWCLASAHLLSVPLGDDMARLFHHLGPRYSANFQAPSLIRFLTYEASASLNIYLSALREGVGAPSPKTPVTPRGKGPEMSPLMKAIKDGVGFTEDAVVFALMPAGASDDPESRRFVANAGGKNNGQKAELRGDVVCSKPQCLDVGLWQVGGPAVTLRLVELAETPQDLCTTLSILCDGLRTSWQNSEDMERMSGYEILASILRQKAQMLNMAGYRVIMEFVGIDFNNPGHSTVANSIAYQFVALDFHIWYRTRKEIQTAHLAHFVALLRDNHFARFNARQRLAKLNIVRKLLYALQTDWYQHDVIPQLVDSMKTVAEYNFSTDAAIKPLVSYLAANLHEDTSGPPSRSPQSAISRLDRKHAHEKAEQVLEAFVSILSDSTRMKKFMSALPLTRICLLLLGDRPSNVVAAQILLMLGLIIKSSPSFPRKFELVSGWVTLKTAIPPAWDPGVHVAAFDLLLGRTVVDGRLPTAGTVPAVACAQIMPTILASFHRGLQNIAADAEPGMTGTSPCGDADGRAPAANDSAVEVLVEELIDLHASSESFRKLFMSQQTTSMFIDAVKTFIDRVAAEPNLHDKTVRLVEKITHLMLMLALDTFVDNTQKRQLLEVLRKSEEAAVAASDGTSPAVERAALVEVTGDRSKRRSMPSVRLSLQIVGDRVLQKAIGRIAAWRNTIIATERKRLRKTAQDIREYHRQVERLGEWRTPLLSERGLWAHQDGPKLWRLDETEGPFRIRKKMEPEHVKAVVGAKVVREDVRDVENPDADDGHSPVAIEVPPWAESYEFSSTEVDDDQRWDDDMKDDKLRRIRHELEPGDVIQAVKTVTRIVGVDSSPGLLILGKSHLYMLDGLVENEEGEVIEARDAPKNVFAVPGTALELEGIQRAQRWPFDQVVSSSKRTCLFRDVALEIYMRDSRTLLVVFSTPRDRQDMHARLNVVSGPKTPDPGSAGGFRTPLLRNVSSKVLKGFGDEIWTAQRRWQAREISNFTYLSIINQTSGRTPADVTQYPVFPWVIADYQSEKLDLDSPSTFRDLNFPMGALTDARREAAQQRYSNLESIGETPFHYGTHFSSSMIVCHYLIRMSPFTHMFKTLQGGDWDIPDRLFRQGHTLTRAYDSASQESRGDVRELIPEFFTCPEFLENSSHLDFGVQQNSGERIDDVKLPAWAKGDPLLFVTLNRQALESDYVSEHLPAWIDLIWGCKQRDADSFNVFHPLSYEGAVDLDNISDELERAATVGIIHNFGQTPRKIFIQPHPPRLMHGVTSLPLGTAHGIEEDFHLILQSSRPFKAEIGASISSIGVDNVMERMFPVAGNTLNVPGYINEFILWGFIDQSLRLQVDRKVVEVAEAASCSCAAFADSECLVTGGEDATVRIWRLTHRSHDMRDRERDVGGALRLMFIMRGHTERVSCVAASRAWSIAVSGSHDGTVSVWDLNRGTYIRTISFGSGQAGVRERIRFVCIHESTGYIASCSGERLALHTINGRVIAVMDLARAASLGVGDDIASLAFHEREWSKRGVLATGGSGGITLRTWDFRADRADDEQAASTSSMGNWRFTTLRSLKCRAEDDGETPTVTALKFVGECLFSGDDRGRMYSWDLPD
ncbi:beach-domain-containing protein [Exidia glandulosa HHB12029]|uniref:Beach-domain-containing protein n=1 Tax=Exidia glandulosa HHB12029 TaxID=1314781 RepID=A0A165D0A8_EXIGL|nr:beach-domain-containing protein [Exidia glandulosa HHB12029]